MTTATLTSRERVNRAMNREDHDRVPRHESFWPDTIRRWKGEGLDGGQDEVLRLLGNDFGGLGAWSTPFPGHHEVLGEDDETVTFVNSWLETVKEWKGRAGTPEHIAWGCSTREKWEKVFKPAIEGDAATDIRNDDVARHTQRANDAGQWRFLATLESFEALRHLLGDVESMINMMEDPEWIAEMSRTWTDAMIRRMEAQLAVAGEIDGVWCYGDMAFNHATMCSPKTYRELIWPDHKRMADWAHDHGAKFIYHTDGNINGVLDLYAEAGFDCIQPLEAKAGMDVCNLAPTYGQKFSLFGNIDVMVMATNDIDKIEAEIKRKFEAAMPTRGYIYHSDHSVPPSVSWETYQQIIELVDKHGWYV